ncbi:hypothetical protein [Micromonospora sp. DT233]|uniref:hypothetical protein n=1 Tax=Micromonospora sp. DT233 TaxID=3393432 RepID=UPI003CF5CCCC
MSVDPIASLRAEVRSVLGGLLDSDLDPTHDELTLSDLNPRYDSLMVLDAVGTIEQTFDVSIDLVEDDLRNTFASVAGIAALVAGKRADASVLAGDF